MRKSLYILCVLFVFSSNDVLAKENSQNINDVTILVSSCDKYAPIWKTFFDLLFKHWPSLKTYNKDVPIVLVSNNIDFHNSRVTMAKSPGELGWNGNINQALKQIKTKYVLYLQDDYYIQDDVLEDKVIDIINAAKAKNLNYVEIAPRCAIGSKKVEGFPFLKYKDPDYGCATTLQAALWEKEALEEMSSDKKATTIWALEGRPLKIHNNFAYYIPRIQPIIYYNFMYRGHIDFYPYCWLYSQGYDMKFLDNYKIHPKYKVIKEFEWLRRNMPKFANFVFFTVGWVKEICHEIKQSVRQILDGVAPR